MIDRLRTTLHEATIVIRQFWEGYMGSPHGC